MKILVSEKLSDHKYKTPEGYLICTDAILARTGKQTYTKDEVFGDGDNTEIDVDRPYDQVMNEKTIASFENKPVTFDHPEEDVNVGNYKSYAVGYVRDVHQGKVDGKDVILGNLVITDQDAINAIESGEHTDLSCGYDCDIKDDGNGYYSQNNIRGNHVALCREGRAGMARIVDSKIKDDSWYVIYESRIGSYYTGSGWASSISNAKKYHSLEEAKQVIIDYGITSNTQMTIMGSSGKTYAETVRGRLKSYDSKMNDKLSYEAASSDDNYLDEVEKMIYKFVNVRVDAMLVGDKLKIAAKNSKGFSSKQLNDIASVLMKNVAVSNITISNPDRFDSNVTAKIVDSKVEDAEEWTIKNTGLAYEVWNGGKLIKKFATKKQAIEWIQDRFPEDDIVEDSKVRDDFSKQINSAISRGKLTTRPYSGKYAMRVNKSDFENLKKELEKLNYKDIKFESNPYVSYNVFFTDSVDNEDNLLGIEDSKPQTTLEDALKILSVVKSIKAKDIHVNPKEWFVFENDLRSRNYPRINQLIRKDNDRVYYQTYVIEDWRDAGQKLMKEGSITSTHPERLSQVITVFNSANEAIKWLKQRKGIK